MNTKERIEQVMAEAFEPFVELKKVLDKYPNVFTIELKEGEGYIMNLDLDYLEPQLEKEVVSL